MSLKLIVCVGLALLVLKVELVTSNVWLCAAAKWPCRVEKRAALSILTMAQTILSELEECYEVSI